MDLPFIKEAIAGLFGKTSCEMYPVKPAEAAPHYRGKIAFHPDKCINCNMCERVCAGGAISSVSEPVEEGMKITRTFYLGSCTFCGHCADFCTHGAIELTSDYHMIATDEEDLMVRGTFIKAPPKKPAPKAPAAPAATNPAQAPKAEEKKAEEPKAEEKKDETPKAEEPKTEEPKAAPAEVKPRDDGKPVQDPSKCIYCTLCAKKCPAGALTVDRAAKTWTLDEDVCVACGTCAGVCPKDAIVI